MVVNTYIRESGIEVLGRIPWGTHFCLFYQTRQDLANVLIPYFRAGLENNEYCVWITSEPLEEAEAKARMFEAVPDFGKYLERGQIEIIPYDQWYVIDGVFDSGRVLSGWVQKLQSALSRGFSGLRLSGNTFWLEKSGWNDFLDYEQAINDTIGKYSMIALCTYSLDRCSANDILDVVSTHQFAMSKRDGEWKLIESKEQKEARKALQETEIRFRSLIQNSFDIIRILDREGRIIFDSPSSERILGYPPSFTLGRSPLDFIHPDDRQLVQSSLGEVYLNVNRGTPTEFRIRKADGEYLDVESTGVNMIGVPGVDGIVITTRPITERKRTEKENEQLLARLRETQVYLESLINYANAPIIVWNPSFTITRFNRAFERISGYMADEVVGKPLSILFPASSRYESLEQIKNTLKGEHWESVEIPIQHKNGSVRIALWNSANVYDEDSHTLVATIAQGQDITRRKKAEKELEEAKLQAELYLDLIAHDISNMHQIMLMQIELAEEILQSDGKLDGDDREILQSLSRTMDKAARLIDNVRKLQKLNTGDYRLEALDLAALIQDVLNTYTNIPGRDITLTYTPCKGSIVRANLLLRDVFLNLIDNAVKHSSGPLEIGIDLHKINLNGRSYYRVAVEDNGKGIPDEKKDEIFQRFKRGHTKTKGTGLGLYLVRSLVEGFGGYVEVQNRVLGDYTKGSRFLVYLPAIGEAQRGGE
ncbi:MEDS domain-containing protein [Methanocella arvoryzae]|uniref:Signal transduction histidine kinase n=1 Tax=Methanocella arvoryzae (strain DSM 22066 / NBRC 105507 / MRE50) TaxID=351160 RepID=Q0W5E3_METAR|nr:MEDS domain-containing protein [Methanocella arvoryzae]CAJ36400.1 putative signal transduction histidine kinase [Methanocella arvoryzae MRE50]